MAMGALLCSRPRQGSANSPRPGYGPIKVRKKTHDIALEPLNRNPGLGTGSSHLNHLRKAVRFRRKVLSSLCYESGAIKTITPSSWTPDSTCKLRKLAENALRFSLGSLVFSATQNRQHKSVISVDIHRPTEVAVVELPILLTTFVVRRHG